MDLKGKVAIVTGAGTGIGGAIAVALARERASVVLSGRRREPLEEVASRIAGEGGQAKVVAADLRQDGEADRLVQVALQTYGRLDVLVNNAGRNGTHHLVGDPLEEWYDIAEWDDIIATNLRGPFLCIRAALPTMVKQRSGVILNILSAGMYSSRASPGTGSYIASKMGLLGATRSLATAVHQYGIRVHALCPGNTDTPMTRKLGVRPPELLARMMQPEDVGEAVRWLVTRPDRVNIEQVAMMPYFSEPWRV
ncbi:MAG: SDR family oxidoreductase [Chloroflexi bacterium]|nr:SDR family oxidoreductase [Chloroflexota bacterium]